MIVVLCLFAGLKLDAWGIPPSKFVYSVLVDGEPVHSIFYCHIAPSTSESASKTEIIAGTYQVNKLNEKTDSCYVYVCPTVSGKRLASLYIPIPNAFIFENNVSQLLIVANSDGFSFATQRGPYVSKRQRVYNTEVYAFTAQGVMNQTTKLTATSGSAKARAKAMDFLVKEGRCDTTNITHPTTTVHNGHQISVPNDQRLLKNIRRAVELYKNVYPDNTLRYIEIEELTPQKISLKCRSYWDSFSLCHDLGPEHKIWFEFEGLFVLVDKSADAFPNWTLLALETSDRPCQELTVDVDLNTDLVTYSRYDYLCQGNQSGQLPGERIVKSYSDHQKLTYQFYIDGKTANADVYVTCNDSTKLTQQSIATNCYELGVAPKTMPGSFRIVANSYIKTDKTRRQVMLEVPIPKDALGDFNQQELIVVADSRSVNKLTQKRLHKENKRLYKVTLFIPTPNGMKKHSLRVVALTNDKPL